MATHRKLNRKELKQPDEFQSIFETAGNFLELHLKEVILGAVGLVVVSAIAIGFYFHEVHQRHMASDRFYQAFNQLQSHQYGAAEQGLTRLATEYPGRAVGRLANFYLASAYLAQKQPGKARDALRRYLAKDDDTSIFRGTAFNNLAVAYAELGDYKQAEDAYRKAAKISGPAQERAQLGVARMLLKQGERDKAIAAYRNFLARSPFAHQRQSVLETLAGLGAKPQAASPTASVKLKLPTKSMPVTP